MITKSVGQCPFCKKNKTRVECCEWVNIDRSNYWVVCENDNCMAEGPIRSTESGAIKAWNKVLG